MKPYADTAKVFLVHFSSGQVFRGKRIIENFHFSTIDLMMVEGVLR